MTPVTLCFLSFFLSLSFPQHNVCTITRTVAAAIGARTVPANIALAAFSNLSHRSLYSKTIQCIIFFLKHQSCVEFVSRV